MPNCGAHNFTDIRQFNLMFKTFQGVTEDAKDEIYLRPETAQGIFVNFANVQRTTRKKIPFGVAQVGKSFRNEITPGKFIFRVREFEQMELEFSANRALTLNGLIIGEVSAVIGFILLTSARITSDFVTTTKKSFASIPKQLQTLNINSRLVGVSFGALQTEQTTTSLSISKQAAKTLNILTRQQAKNMFLMLLSRHSVLSVYSWHFLPDIRRGGS